MKKTILVVDDEEGVRDAFLLALEDTGHQVITAEDGEDGLAKAKLDKPDLVFTDLKMPNMNGVNFMKALLELYGEVPVYVVTAFHEEYMEDLKTASADGLKFNVVRKPVNAEQICWIVSSVFDGPQNLQSAD